jgi:hypothetical protein
MQARPGQTNFGCLGPKPFSVLNTNLPPLKAASCVSCLSADLKFLTTITENPPFCSSPYLVVLELNKLLFFSPAECSRAKNIFVDVVKNIRLELELVAEDT